MKSLKGGVSPVGEAVDSGTPDQGKRTKKSRRQPHYRGSVGQSDFDKSRATEDRSQLDALGQQNLLLDAFPEPSKQTDTDENEAAAAVAENAAPKVGHASYRRRIVKTVLGLAIFAGVGFMPVQRFFEASSVEAVVNARIVTIRAPIDGRVEAGAALPEVGSAVAANTILLRVINRRADRGRLDDLRRLIDLLESERGALIARLGLLRAQHTELVEQTRYFQRARVLQLEARIDEIKSQISAAVATRSEAATALERSAKLLQAGAQSKAGLERAQRDLALAAEGETSLRRRLAGAEVELEAARQGKYVGDSYNDRPSSSQHADDIALRIAESEADLSIRDERLDRLKSNMREEAVRYADQQSAELAIPVSGQVWEVMTAPGEEVRAGRELLRILDCTGVVVTAVVSAKTYASLRIGGAARFQPVGESRDYAGTIVRLSGLAAPFDNLAIDASALGRELYRVTVSVPDLRTSTCSVGRNGKVVFDTVGSSASVGTIGSQLFRLLNWQ